METRESGAFFNQENGMFDMQAIGSRIALLRRKAGLTQAELAEKLGISYQAVSSWERGATMPDIGKLLELARALNTTVDALLSGKETEGEQNPEPPQTEKEDQEKQSEGKQAPLNLEDVFKSAAELLGAVSAKSFHAKVMDKAAEIQEKAAQMAAKVRVTVKPKRKLNTDALFAAAPYLEQEELAKYFAQALEDGDEDVAEELSGYLDEDWLQKAVASCDKPLSAEMLGSIGHALSQENLEKCLQQALAEDDDEIVEEIAVYLEQETLESALEKCTDPISIEIAAELASYASERALDLIVEKCEIDDPAELIEELGEYLSSKQLKVLLRRASEE